MSISSAIMKVLSLYREFQWTLCAAACDIPDVGPRWAPCWPHEPCYQGYYIPHWCNGDSPSPCHQTINHGSAMLGFDGLQGQGNSNIVRLNWFQEIKNIFVFPIIPRQSDGKCSGNLSSLKTMAYNQYMSADGMEAKEPGCHQRWYWLKLHQQAFTMYTSMESFVR